MDRRKRSSSRLSGTVVTERALRMIVRGLLREGDDPELERAIAHVEKNFPRHFQVGGYVMRGPDGEIYSRKPPREDFGPSHPFVWEPSKGAFLEQPTWERVTGKTANPPPKPPDIPPEQHPDYRPSRKKGTLPDHDASAPFEKWAFAPQRRGTPIAAPEMEPNTPVENVVYFELLDHLEHNKPISPEVFNLVASMMKSGAYSDVFEPLPPSTPIYRGVAMTAAQMVKHGITDVPGQYEGEDFEIEIMFGKKNATSSWTLDEGKAYNFAMGTAEVLSSSRRIVILTSTVGNAGVVIPMKNFYAVAGGVGESYAPEQEVVCLGPVKTTSVFISGQDNV